MISLLGWSQQKTYKAFTYPLSLKVAPLDICKIHFCPSDGVDIVHFPRNHHPVGARQQLFSVLKIPLSIGAKDQILQWNTNRGLVREKTNWPDLDELSAAWSLMIVWWRLFFTTLEITNSTPPGLPHTHPACHVLNSVTFYTGCSKSHSAGLIY